MESERHNWGWESIFYSHWWGCLPGIYTKHYKIIGIQTAQSNNWKNWILELVTNYTKPITSYHRYKKKSFLWYPIILTYYVHNESSISSAHKWFSPCCYLLHFLVNRLQYLNYQISFNNFKLFNAIRVNFSVKHYLYKCNILATVITRNSVNEEITIRNGEFSLFF